MKKFWTNFKNWIKSFDGIFSRIWELFKKCRWAQILLAIIVLITCYLTVREIYYDDWYKNSKIEHRSPAAIYIEEMQKRDSLLMQQQDSLNYLDTIK